MVVDVERCFGCAACIAVCPLDALELEGILAIPTEDKCTHWRSMHTGLPR